jgi:chorismate--pyruvate lyase
MHNTPEPYWQPMTELPDSLPSKVREWLTAEISLTVRLQALGAFQVELLQEGWGKALPSEQTLLSLGKEEKIGFRDVVLTVDNKPRVVGHTLFPMNTLNAIPALKTLGTRSLGDLIFKELKGTREKLEFAFLAPEHDLYKLTEYYCSTHVQILYARRSLICVQSQELLINEAFIFGD